MLAALNTKEADSKQSKENMMTYHSTKLGDLVMIKTLIKNQIGMQKVHT